MDGIITHRVGGAGTWEAIFNAEKPSQTSIHLEYCVASHSDLESIYILEIIVTVTDNGTIVVDNLIEY